MVPSSGGNVSFHELADPAATQRAAAELQDDPARAALAETLVATAQRDGGLSLHAHHTLHPAATWGQTEQSAQQGPQQTEPRPHRTAPSHLWIVGLTRWDWDALAPPVWDHAAVVVSIRGGQASRGRTGSLGAKQALFFGACGKEHRRWPYLPLFYQRNLQLAAW